MGEFSSRSDAHSLPLPSHSSRQIVMAVVLLLLPACGSQREGDFSGTPEASEGIQQDGDGAAATGSEPRSSEEKEGKGIPGPSDREVTYGLSCGEINYPHFQGKCKWVGVARSDVVFVISGALETVADDGSTVNWKKSGVMFSNFTEGHEMLWFPAPESVGPLEIDSVKNDVVRLIARNGSEFLFAVRRLEYEKT